MGKSKYRRTPTVYTNHLPLTILVDLMFSENLINININSVINQPNFSNVYSANYYVSAPGTQQLQIQATDQAGNIGYSTADRLNLHSQGINQKLAAEPFLKLNAE